MAALFDSIGIKALDRESVERLVRDAGHPGYRAGQLIHWLYGRAASSYDEMSNLPIALREQLSARAPIRVPELVTREISRTDGTRKYLWRLADGVTVESVGLPEGRRLTVCFSTQAGCAMGCTFCATGRDGFVRDLGCGEMVDQVTFVGRDFGQRVTNAVAMGQGEPFANYDASLAALRLMNDSDGPGIGARHLTVSTCGLIHGVTRFAEEPEQFTLAVSLHSAVQDTRDHLMPGVRGASLTALHAALAAYGARTGRRPTLEYALMAGVNDSDDELAALLGFCRGLHCHVNLIPINPVRDSEFRRSESSRVVGFRDALQRSGTEASIRSERGADIDAACGQLRQRHKD
ncbi:MAG: 23S rRNA (adenine(2503)-C(2))-methyltransferase RlmN [Coriobacteriia bacterium]|nr:23S rRNA (adenine(2503)-C(2))-methyltransferase RlmN [Coriobacteriia bacterium]